jgi:lysophospholipase L1-like esterase
MKIPSRKAGGTVAAALHLSARRLVALAGGALLSAGFLVSAADPAAAAPGSGPTAVVALGDSAISGEGAGAYEPGTDGPGGDFCHRSTRALIQETSIPGIQNRISLACSGAASSDVRINGTTHYTEPSQADRLRAVARDNDVKMIVLQIGANDDPHFADTVLSCVQAWANPFGRACSATLGPVWPGRVAAMAPKVEASVDDVRTVMRAAGYADSSYQFVLQSYASPFTENMNSITHAFEGCPIRLADAKFSRTQAVGQLSAALRGVAQRTGVRFLDLARASEGHEACNKSTSDHWITPLTVDVGTLLHSADPSHIVQQSFHPNANGHAQLGTCLTEFYADGLGEGQCLRGADGNLHATAGITAPTARALAVG